MKVFDFIYWTIELYRLSATDIPPMNLEQLQQKLAAQSLKEHRASTTSLPPMPSFDPVQPEHRRMSTVSQSACSDYTHLQQQVIAEELAQQYPQVWIYPIFSVQKLKQLGMKRWIKLKINCHQMQQHMVNDELLKQSQSMPEEILSENGSSNMSVESVLSAEQLALKLAQNQQNSDDLDLSVSEQVR